MGDKFIKGETVIIPSGHKAIIDYVAHDEYCNNAPLYWLDNGLYAYEFELRKIIENK